MDLPRDALERELRAALTTQRVVLLCAPAGFGKTTVLVSALSSLPADVTTAWVEVDALDDLGRLSACLLGALEPLDLPWRISPESLVAALDGGNATRAAWAVALANVLHDSSAARGVLVLDALDRCEDRAVFAFIDALLPAWPRHWTLALTSRVEPPFALARWHVQEEVAEFRQDVLRLNIDELSALYGSETSLGTAALQALHDLTQGWPAAAALLLHARRGSVRTDAAPALAGEQRRRLFAYLGSEVLDQLPEMLAEFVVRCAVLPEWDAARCEAVTGCGAAALLLEQVQQRGLFGRHVGGNDAADSPAGWAPDPLFLGFLDEQLQHRYPSERPALMQRAAASERDATRRVDLLLRAGLPGRAAQALLEATPQWLEAGNALHLSHMLERFAAADRDTPPWHAARAQLAWRRWDWAAMDDAASRAELGYAGASDAASAGKARALRAMARIGMSDLDGAAALLAEGDTPGASSKMHRLAHATAQAWLANARGPAAAAAAWQDRVTDLLVSTDAPRWLWLQCTPNYRMATMHGLGSTVLRFIREALHKAGDEPTPLRLAALTLSCWAQLSRGEFEAAAHGLDELSHEAEWTGLPRSLQWGVTHARLLLATLGGQAHPVSDDLSDRVLADFPAGNPWRRFVLSWLLRLAWYAADDQAWTRWYTLLRSAPPVREWPMAAAAVRLADGLQALRDDDIANAAIAFDEAADVLRTCDANGLLDSTQALQAWCFLRRGRRDDAARALHACLQRTTDEGHCCGLLLAGRPVLSALAPLVPAAGPLRDAWQRTYAKLDPAAPVPRSRKRDAVPVLSARERDVLTCVAAGDSNKVIARTLALSPHTVKRHIANILDKLGVSTRAQAAVWFSAQQRERGAHTV